MENTLETMAYNETYEELFTEGFNEDMELKAQDIVNKNTP